MFNPGDRVMMTEAALAHSRRGRAGRAGTVAWIAREDGPRAGCVYVCWDGAKNPQPINEYCLRFAETPEIG
jgi:hypothetical protein